MIPPFVLAPVILTGALVALAYLMWSSPLLRGLLSRTDLSVLVALGVLAAVVHGADSSWLFYGNEYEDSYEYLASARLLGTIAWSLYFNPVCILGSLEACVAGAATSHPIGYSALAAAVSSWTGDSLRAAVLISVLSGALAVPSLYVVARLGSLAPSGAAIASCSYLAFPIARLYAPCPTPESASVLLSLLLVLAWILAVRDRDRARAARILALAVLPLLLVSAVLLRRDHLVLTIALPTAMLAESWAMSDPAKRSGILRAGGALALGLLPLWWMLDPRSAGMEELATYSTRFQPQFLLDLVPKYLASLVRPQWYLLLPIGAAFAFAIDARRVLFWGILGTSYLVLFSVFDHGFYYPATGELSEAHLGRYMTQAAPFVALLIGAAADRVISSRAWNSFGRRRQVAVLAGSVACLAVASQISFTALQEERMRWESAYRLEPARRVLDSIDTDTWLLTIEPVLFHVLGGGRVRVVDFAALSGLISDTEFQSLWEGQVVYYARGECSGMDRTRYRSQCELVERWLKTGGRRIRTSDLRNDRG